MPQTLTWSLPGAGQARPDCGKWAHYSHPWGRCTHYRRVKNSCSRAICPICCKTWAAREAHSIERRVSAGMRASKRRQACHYSVSYDPKESIKAWATVEGYKRLRTQAYRVLRDVGVSGATLVPHYLRLGSERWGGDGCARASPHWHALGNGWLHNDKIPKSWVVVNLGVRKSVFQTALYLLSHAGIAHYDRGILPYGNLPCQERVALECVTWFGTFAYNKLRVPKEVSEGIYCKVCEENVPANQWSLTEWIGQGPPPADSGVCAPGQWRIRELVGYDNGTRTGLCVGWVPVEA